MIWATVIGSLVGVVGLLYGLLERSWRQAAVLKADTISKQLDQETSDRNASVVRYEQLVSDFKGKIASLQKELDANLPPAAVRQRLNDLLTWRLYTPPTSTGSVKGAVPDPAAPTNGGG